MKKAYIIYITGFLFALLFPMILYPLIKDKLDHDNHENRELMTVEGLAGSDWTTFFPALETFIDDNMLYKNESIKAIKWVDENIFHDLFDRSVVVGKEDWLFYKGNDCIQDYRGGYPLSEEELQGYAAAAKGLDDALRSLDIDLCIMITPNKEAVYGDRYLPDKIKKRSSKSRADQIVAYLRENTDIKVVYPKEALQDASTDHQVWKRYDTHWNDIGAFVAVQELLAGLDVTPFPLTGIKVEKDGLCSGDLAGMLGMTARYSDDVVYRIKGYDTGLSYESTDHVVQPNLSYSAYASDAENDQTLLCIGDSFLGSMEQYLTLKFSKTMFVHRDNYTSLEKDLILEEAPDVVVFQTAERFLTYFDDQMLRYAGMYDRQ